MLAYLGHHASPGHKVSLRPRLVFLLSLRVQQCLQQAVEMGVLFVLIVPERLEAFLEICAYRRRDVVVDA